MYGPTETTVYMTRRELTRAFVDRATASDIGGSASIIRGALHNSGN